MKQNHVKKHKAGDWVEVRSRGEILATLDGKGCLDALPFMPEMLKYCGMRFQVYKRAHKTCDTVNKTRGRRVVDAVHLHELRCTGEAHGGCQAQCLLFWKQAWLKPAAGPPGSGIEAKDSADSVARGPIAGPGRCTQEDLQRATIVDDGSTPNDPTYACQATDLPKYTTLLNWWDVRQYIEDYASGNTSLGRLAQGLFYSAYNKLVNAGLGLGKILRWLYDATQGIRRGYPYPRRRGTIPVGKKTPSVTLDLQPGECVRVKTYKEIVGTLDQRNKNRGMYFDAEEVPYCGKVFRVVSRVERIINEQTGKMLHFKNPSVILDGAFCQSRYSERRMFCPRSIYTLWREVWLERVPDVATSSSTPERRPDADTQPTA